MAKVSQAPITVTVKGDRIIIDAPLSSPTPSASGKTMVIASSHGNIATDAKVNGHEVIVGFNAYFRA
jgi:hypothetical protein